MKQYEYWQAVAEHKEKEWKRIWGNHENGPLVYWRDVASYKSLARVARVHEGVSVCWGASDCLSQQLTTCAAGKHETCEEHRNTCCVCQRDKELDTG